MKILKLNLFTLITKLLSVSIFSLNIMCMDQGNDKQPNPSQSMLFNNHLSCVSSDREVQKLIAGYLKNQFCEYLTIQQEPKFLQVGAISSLTHSRYDIHRKAISNPYALSSDGTYLATVDSNDNIKILDVNSNSIQSTIERNELNSNINRLVFSPNGKFLASQNIDDLVRLIDLKTNESLFVKATAFDFSPDNKSFAFVGDNKTGIVDLEVYLSKYNYNNISTCDEPIRDRYYRREVLYSSDSKYFFIFSIGEDGMLANCEKRERLKYNCILDKKVVISLNKSYDEDEVYRPNIKDFSRSPNNNHILIGIESNIFGKVSSYIRIFDCVSNKSTNLEKSLQVGAISSLTHSPCGKYLACVYNESGNNILRIFDLKNGFALCYSNTLGESSNLSYFRPQLTYYSDKIAIGLQNSIHIFCEQSLAVLRNQISQCSVCEFKTADDKIKCEYCQTGNYCSRECKYSHILQCPSRRADSN